MPPGQLIASLETIRKRAKWLSVLYGLALLILGASGLIVMGALADYLLRLPGIPRLIGLVLAAAVAAYVFWQFVLKPARARLSLQDVAGRVEETFPQFNDRLRSSVQFLGERDALAADPLRRRTVEQAGEIARRIEFDDVLITRPAYLAVGGAMAAVLALAALAFLLGPVAQTIVGRLFDPLDPTHQWPKRFMIAPLDLDDRVPAGRQVMVNVQLKKGRAESVDPVVYYQLDGGRIGELLMTRQTDGTFSAAIDTRLPVEQAQGELKIWVNAGDDTTQPQTVAIVPRLVLNSAEATIIPPPYVQSGRTIQADLTEGPAVVGVGSELTLRLNFNKQLAEGDAIKLEPVGDSARPELIWQRETDRTVVAKFTAQQTLRFNVAATDIDGFIGDVPQTFEVVVRPDQSPTVQIENPRRNESRTAVAVVPLVAVAEDDFGFREISLVVRKLGEGGFERVIPLAGDAAAQGVRIQPIGDAPDRERLRLSYDWDLAQLAPEGTLKSGDVLEYSLRAQDNFELDGTYHEPVESAKLRISIISQEELNQRVVGELRNVKDQVAAAKQAQDRNQRETAELSEQSRDKPQLDEADRAAASRLSRQQSAVAATTKRLSDKVGEIQQTLQENRSTADDLRDLTGEVTEALEQTAEDPMKQAASDLEQSANEAANVQRAREALAQSQAKQQDASERLRQTIEQMEKIGSLRSTIDEVAGLLQAQKELGERANQLARRNAGLTPEQMSAEDRADNQRQADEQQQLSERTQQALEEMERLAEEMKQSDPASSESLDKAAQTGKQQQVPQQQQQAADAQRQNQQSRSQQSRQQAEIGLEMMLSELKEAERRKLEELSRKLTEMQEQIERLVRRQAGHNLDNRSLAGEDVPAEALAQLRTLAGIEGDDPVQPSLPRLSTGQEQTERNTRDISRTAEDLPEGSAIANLLTRASSRMERAAVFLRQKDLPAAYEPPQVEALTSLQDALAAVDEQKQAVDEQIEEQQRETIRAKLQAIRDEQARSVNEPTLQLQGKKDDGIFRARPDQIKLNALPAAQQGLAERVNALTEDLANVGGVAFVYANKQMKIAMDGVQQRLAQSDTSRPTQIEEERIVDGLDAMIDSLKISPRDNERFDRNSQANSGGEGQQGEEGGPQLPPETELKLIKALQGGVNRATRELAELKQQAGEADEPLGQRIVATGDQQGELRGVLDQMLRQYSRGQIKFGPEPDPAQQLPDGAAEADVEDDELANELLGQNAGEGGADAMRIGDRMARSRQRLALNKDPGKTTQIIQDRIVIDIDSLIEQAQAQQQQQASNQQQQRRRRQQQEQQQRDQQAQNQGENQQGEQPQPGQQPAQASRDTSPGGAADASADLAESMAEWGQLTPRQRQAILDSKDQQMVDRYRQLIEDYWKSMSQKRSQDPR